MTLACKELPTEIATKEGLGHMDGRGTTELEDIYEEGARVRKRVKSTSPQTPLTRYVDGDVDGPTPSHQLASAVTSMTVGNNNNVSLSDEAVKAAQANEYNALADESEIRALTFLSNHSDPDIASKAKSLILSLLDKWGA